MDDIKLFAKNEKELETLIHTVRIYSPDRGMEFGIEKCAMLVMKSIKRQLTDGMELPNQDKIITLTVNETYKYLGILKTDTIKQVEMKDKIQKEYLRRTRKLLDTKLNSRNLIKGINTLAVPLVRYSGPFLKWTRDEHMIFQSIALGLREMTLFHILTSSWCTDFRTSSSLAILQSLPSLSHFKSKLHWAQGCDPCFTWMVSTGLIVLILMAFWES